MQWFERVELYTKCYKNQYIGHVHEEMIQVCLRAYKKISNSVVWQDYGIYRRNFNYENSKNIKIRLLLLFVCVFSAIWHCLKSETHKQCDNTGSLSFITCVLLFFAISSCTCKIIEAFYAFQLSKDNKDHPWYRKQAEVQKLHNDW